MEKKKVHHLQAENFRPTFKESYTKKGEKFNEIFYFVYKNQKAAVRCVICCLLSNKARSNKMDSKKGLSVFKLKWPSIGIECVWLFMDLLLTKCLVAVNLKRKVEWRRAKWIE